MAMQLVLEELVQSALFRIRQNRPRVRGCSLIHAFVNKAAHHSYLNISAISHNGAPHVGIPERKTEESALRQSESKQLYNSLHHQVIGGFAFRRAANSRGLVWGTLGHHILD